MTGPRTRKPRRRWRVLILSIVLLALIGVDFELQLRTRLEIGQTTSFDLAPGSRFDRNLTKLSEIGAFATSRQRFYLAAYARWRGVTTKIKSGEYALEPGLTPRALLALWVSGKTVMHEVRLIEGWRFSQAWEAIQQSSALTHTLATANDPAAIMAALGESGVAAEGRFFPDTYRFRKGTTDLAFLRAANDALDRILKAEWELRAPDLPFENSDQALVLASIIEKESASKTERQQIAGVFVRRLRLGMRLQTDPTVIYGLGDTYDGDIRSRDLTSDTPYNTYLREGLPPTPICLPGRESIHAALHPDDSNALYFVSRGDGTHQFSATLAEQVEAVRRYQLKNGGLR